MRVTTKVAFVTLVALAFPSVRAIAQDEDVGSSAPAETSAYDAHPLLFPGQLIRVTTSVDGFSGSQTRTGKITDVLDGGFALRLPGVRSGIYASPSEPRTVDIPYASIIRLDIARSAGSHFATGFLIGGVAGAVFGAAARDTESNHPAAPGLNAAVVALSVVVGAALGGAVGASVPKYEWVTLPPDRSRVSGSTSATRK